MAKRGVSRREFVKTTTAFAGALCAPAVLRHALAQEAQVPVRLPAHELNADHPIVKSFKAAILVMRGSEGRPDYHPAHWQQLRRYHAQLCGPNGDADPRADVHGTWWFLPWHRAYLAVVEQLMREDSGDATFARPYWDWHRHPKLPAIFEGDPAANPLAHARRWLNNPEDQADWDRLKQYWEGLTAADEGATVSRDAFDEFAGGPIVLGPDGPGFGTQPAVDPIHGGGHIYIGGVQGDMGAFPTAGLDPIFYCHHANLDRVWEVWRNSTPQGAPQRKEPSDHGAEKAWSDRPFAFQDALGGAVIA
ncbi:MAG: tyrosinase family protein, partial [Hyphomicrobium sp.]|nr:tyrosinase family protein [Hyphomicrobium sp.]